jgi:hypothetical protein
MDLSVYYSISCVEVYDHLGRVPINCNDPRFYQILGKFFAFVLLEMFGNSQGFKTF